MTKQANMNFRKTFRAQPLILNHHYKIVLEYWIKQNGICPLCDYQLINPLTQHKFSNEYNVPTIDHIIPISRNGQKDITKNGRLVHSICNEFRGNILDKDFDKVEHILKVREKLLKMR